MDFVDSNHRTMSGVTLSTAVLLLTLAVSGIHGFRKGAPVGQCDKMTPNHSNNSAQTGTSPYTVTASKATYSGGDTITGESVSVYFKNYSCRPVATNTPPRFSPGED